MILELGKTLVACADCGLLIWINAPREVAYCFDCGLRRAEKKNG